VLPPRVGDTGPGTAACKNRSRRGRPHGSPKRPRGATPGVAPLGEAQRVLLVAVDTLEGDRAEARTLVLAQAALANREADVALGGGDGDRVATTVGGDTHLRLQGGGAHRADRATGVGEGLRTVVERGGERVGRDALAAEGEAALVRVR